MSTSIPLSRVKPLTAQVLVDRVDDPELAGQPLDAQPVGDGQPGRVVGEHLVLVPQLDRRERHLLDRRPAVGPVRVRVQVPAQLRPQLLAALHQRPEGRLELGQPLGHLTVDGVGDHGRGARADARQVRQRAGLRARGDLVGRQRQDHRRRVAEGLDPAGLLAAALHQERDPAQGRDRSSLVRARHLPRTFFSPHPVDERVSTSSLVSGLYAARAPRVVHSRDRSEATCPPLLHRSEAVVPRVIHRLSTGDTPVALTPSPAAT